MTGLKFPFILAFVATYISIVSSISYDDDPSHPDFQNNLAGLPNPPRENSRSFSSSPRRNFPGISSSQSQSPAVNQLPLWESNQTRSSSPSRATTLSGVPYPSLTASQSIGTRGHLLFQDFYLIDKLSAFVRERIPERVVHARGAGAHGYFQVTHDISSYTKAKFLNGVGKITPVFVRFSTAVGEIGTPDTAVDHHGFATRFYSEDGNHDIVGNNVEVLAIRDPMLFGDLNRSRKRNPVTNLDDQNSWWDFTSLRPESVMHTLHLFSDKGRPDGFRRQDGFGAHAFKLVNSTGGVIFAKFHWRSRQRAPALTHEDYTRLMGENPEYLTQDLYDAIERKDYPSWDFFIQVMTIEQARRHPRNPFDLTRTWREEDFPLIPVGRMILNRNPENYFAEVEQAGFLVSNMVPGIEPSPDRVLAARLFAYQDAQKYRLGVNGPQLPINRPRFEVESYNRNGKSCHGRNGGGSPNYFPNSFGGAAEGKEEDVGQVNFKVEGVVDRYDIEEDEYIEARMFLERDVGEEERRRMVSAIGVRLARAKEEIRERTLKNIFYPVQKRLGDEVRREVERYLKLQRRNENRNN